jgi:hypothetical protein
MFERVPVLVKMKDEIPSDMLTTLHTLLYASNRAGVDELVSIGSSIANLCGKKFVSQTKKDEKCVHEVVRENINMITPEEGWKVERLMEIAREINLPYTPSERNLIAYKKYMNSKGGILGPAPDPLAKFSDHDGSSKIAGMSIFPVQPSAPNVMPSTMPQPVVQPGPYGNFNTKLIANLGPSQYPPPTSNYPPANPSYHQIPPGGNNFQTRHTFQQSSVHPSVPQYPPTNPNFTSSGIQKQNNPPPYGYQQPPTTMPNCTSKVIDPNQLPPSNPSPSMPKPSASIYSNKDIDLFYPSVGPMPDSVIGAPQPDPKVSEIDDFEARLANLKNN